jgi:hypothetical protein
MDALKDVVMLKRYQMPLPAYIGGARCIQYILTYLYWPGP